MIDAAQDAFADVVGVGHGWLDVGLVLDGDVEEDAFVLVVHASDAFLDDDGDFVGVGGVVGDEVGDGGGEHVAVTVLVLEALAVEGGATGGGADQEAAGLGVAGGVGEVADALESEHGVEDEEGDHGHFEGGVGHAAGDEGGHGAGLGDAFFEHLAVAGFFVEEQAVGIDGLVELAGGGVDAELAEHAFHAEGARLVGHDGNDVLAEARDRA